MSKAEKETLTGLVVFLSAGEGSKSEGVYPFLYQGREAEVVKLKLKGDNPFENNGFVQYDGRRVELTGVRTHAGTLVAETVTVLDSPLEPVWEDPEPVLKSAVPAASADDAAAADDAAVADVVADPVEFEKTESENETSEADNEKE